GAVGNIRRIPEILRIELQITLSNYLYSATTILV
ncbi:MAG: hypothetical protein RL609_1176, partial [Bacteroidota bacterium]